RGSSPRQRLQDRARQAADRRRSGRSRRRETMSLIQDIAERAVRAAINYMPDRWLFGAPDTLMHKHGLIGGPVSRVDGRLKVQGQVRFAAEVAFENLTYAALLCSTVARGRITSLDTSEASAAPGVVLVMTYRNAPRMARPPVMMTSAKAGGSSDLPVMQ